MRVSISPMGSPYDINRSPLPARLHHARNLSRRGQVPERNTRQLELAIVGARPPRELAAVAHAHRRAVARQLGELEAGGEALLRRLLLVVRDCLKLVAAARVLLHQPLAPLVLLDRTLLGHAPISVRVSLRTAGRTP